MRFAFDCRNFDGRARPNPLCQAIQKADMGDLKRLLDHGMDSNALDTDGTPALMAAAPYNFAETVRLLLDRGAVFLLKSQYQNGAWFVKSRAYPVQPYFESGYPFGHNQWISATAAGWASLAIAETLPDTKLAMSRGSEKRPVR